jgi:hypothetical protein
MALALSFHQQLLRLVVVAVMVEMLEAQVRLAVLVVAVKVLVEIVIFQQDLAHQVKAMLAVMVTVLRLEQKAVEVAVVLEL